MWWAVEQVENTNIRGSMEPFWQTQDSTVLGEEEEEDGFTVRETMGAGNSCWEKEKTFSDI